MFCVFTNRCLPYFCARLSTCAVRTRLLTSREKKTHSRTDGRKGEKTKKLILHLGNGFTQRDRVTCVRMPVVPIFFLARAGTVDDGTAAGALKQGDVGASAAEAALARFGAAQRVADRVVVVFGREVRRRRDALKHVRVARCVQLAQHGRAHRTVVNRILWRRSGLANDAAVRRAIVRNDARQRTVSHRPRNQAAVISGTVRPSPKRHNVSGSVRRRSHRGRDRRRHRHRRVVPERRRSRVNRRRSEGGLHRRAQERRRSHDARRLPEGGLRRREAEPRRRKLRAAGAAHRQSAAMHRSFSAGSAPLAVFVQRRGRVSHGIVIPVFFLVPARR